MKLLVFAFIIVVVFITGFYLIGSEDIWKKYGLQPFESEDVDTFMKALKIYRETYAIAEDVEDKIEVRLGIEEARKCLMDFYNEKGQELGLDPDTADRFSRDMIKKNKV
jgi:hypothetical protein